jgi:hypothetical protein
LISRQYANHSTLDLISAARVDFLRFWRITDDCAISGRIRSEAWQTARDVIFDCAAIVEKEIDRSEFGSVDPKYHELVAAPAGANWVKRFSVQYWHTPAGLVVCDAAFKRFLKCVKVAVSINRNAWASGELAGCRTVDSATARACRQGRVVAANRHVKHAALWRVAAAAKLAIDPRTWRASRWAATSTRSALPGAAAIN